MSKPLEKIYQKKSQLEHILLRPDSYIGSIECHEAQMWVSSYAAIEFKKIDYCPGLYKIFDEVLVNAADNLERDKKMTKIEVDIEKDGWIRVTNDGSSIPIAVHRYHNVYIAELIFGHLLTSSNYDDNEKKVVGGRNGYGAKLANIFSKRFEVETGDGYRHKRLRISWSNNMSEMNGPTIYPYTAKDFTTVRFLPDYARFGMSKGLHDDMRSLLEKRVYDMAGILKVKVFLNAKEIKIKNFNQYVDLYLGNEAVKISDSTPRWKVILCPNSDREFQHISFVNSISTTRGGTHVNYIMDQVVAALLPALKKKYKDIDVKPFQIKSFFFLFLSCQIYNPAFDSQTKYTLTTKASSFGSTFEISQEMVKEILKSNVVDRIISMVKARDQMKLSKQLKKKKGDRVIIPKLEEANLAGKGVPCTLILTEGDSAKSLAMSGIQRLGRDHYGVFPLRGKLLNVSEITIKQLTENEELKSIVKILGLEFNKNYTSANQLRYSSVMIMADQDNDGSHIKGLILNFFNTYWPSLCNVNGFLKEFVTPIVRCRKGDRTLDFFSLPDYQKWSESEESSGWKIKYYKGLGTSTDKEAQEYFSQLNKHQITFSFNTPAESTQALELAFNKKNADMRKYWLSQYDAQLSVNYNRKILTVREFVNQYLIHYSNADNVRSIPSIVDGLKPSQRKILFSCFKRNLRSEIKVAQLAGYVSEHSAYHHGEMSLCQTIIAMAQDFIGSNNLNLLQPIGQFGTRALGGKDAASARYIYTNLSPITRLLFVEHDDHVVDYLVDEGQSVEPEYYYPILPLVLINGADGIGTGWSTTIHPFKVQDVIDMMRQRLEKKEIELPIVGWYGFQGTIEQNSKGYHMKGVFSVEDNTVSITELPVKKWTRDYKSFLYEKLETSYNRYTAELEDLREYHMGDRVHFVIEYLEGKLPYNIEKELKLSCNLQNSNMVLFNSAGSLQKYEYLRLIVEEFYEVRLKAYETRKKYLLSKVRRELQLMEQKLRFIREVSSGYFKLEGSKAQWVDRLASAGYVAYQHLPKVQSTKLYRTEEESSNYDYILTMPIWTFSKYKINELEDNIKKHQQQLRELESTTEVEMWLYDLRVFEEGWRALKGHSDESPKKVAKKPIKKRKLSEQSFVSEIEISDSEEKSKKKKFKEISENEEKVTRKDIINLEEPKESKSKKLAKKKGDKQIEKEQRAVEAKLPEKPISAVIGLLDKYLVNRSTVPSRSPLDMSLAYRLHQNLSSDYGRFEKQVEEIRRQSPTKEPNPANSMKLYDEYLF